MDSDDASFLVMFVPPLRGRTPNTANRGVRAYYYEGSATQKASVTSVTSTSTDARHAPPKQELLKMAGRRSALPCSWNRYRTVPPQN